jgi:hypothetical protein
MMQIDVKMYQSVHRLLTLYLFSRTSLQERCLSCKQCCKHKQMGTSKTEPSSASALVLVLVLTKLCDQRAAIPASTRHLMHTTTFNHSLLISIQR